MTPDDNIFQDPAPGKRLIRFRGDIQTFTLSLAHPQAGDAWLRTNIGHGADARREVIREVDAQEAPLGCDWYDIPMHRMDERTFSITVALDEVGHFEAKCFFKNKDDQNPSWPQGPNFAVNVEPADTCCFNTIYNAFVRQFGPNRSGKFVSDASRQRAIQDLDQSGFAVIPPSGKFRDLMGELDFIIGELGCRMIQLLPIHPTPTTYGRMGRFGSPFAALSFKTVDPALAVFDPKATPLEQFIELVDAVHARNAKVIIDFTVNHTGWAARLHNTHPQWLVRDSEGRIAVPSAWGVQWEDLTKLDYTQKGLWQFMAEVFLLWCRRGVDGFRCDAGYMIPLDAWRYMVARVRDSYPDTLFFLEGLGGKISVTRDLLNRGNLNWAYSELFQNYDRHQIEAYLPEAIDISQTDGILVHFSETHDNNRLAARAQTFAKMRTALCALCSHSGAFGFANGVEWYATEKIDVHGATSLNWGVEINQIPEIRRLTALLRVHPAFFDQAETEMIQKGEDEQLVLLRHHRPTGNRLLVLANLSDIRESLAKWEVARSGIDGAAFVDLLTGEKLHITIENGSAQHSLAPGQVRCLSPNRDDIRRIENTSQTFTHLPERIEHQQRRAKVLDILRHYRKIVNFDGFDMDGAADELLDDPLEFCRKQNPHSEESRVIVWEWPHDLKREMMIPPEHFLFIRAIVPFRADLIDEDTTVSRETGLRKSDGTYFALFYPRPIPSGFRSLTLNVTLYEKNAPRHETAPILYLPETETLSVPRVYRRQDVDPYHIFLGTNGRGAMLRAPVSWGRLTSRYDALLAANLDPKIPEDRWIMLARCRIWVVYQDYSQEIRDQCLNTFCADRDARGIWEFQVPTGQGEHVRLAFGLEMIPGENRIRLSVHRCRSEDHPGMLADTKEVQIIIRPDIENRSFHDVTKAYTGPEHGFPDAVDAQASGFCFAPDPVHRLHVEMPSAAFIEEPEWLYMVHRPMDAERGHDPDSDLFSPGFFSVFLEGGQHRNLHASVSGKIQQISGAEAVKEVMFSDKKDTGWRIDAALHKALDHFIIHRGPFKSIVAGYPWFLDWGRDALIVVRGMIADGRIEDAKAVLKLFGQFEDRGTLPNMIRGNDAGNRDTSDAPLWFLTACDDLVRYAGDEGFLDERCGSRSIRGIALSIGKSYIQGTPNGIGVDPESGLVFSPTHFTWMDTNFPAGTPRQGYPVEIQALWFAALKFLARIDPGSDWKMQAINVQTALLEHFYLKEKSYLSDCLHAGTGQAVKGAEADDALRPNQLFAVTLGAVSDPVVCRSILASCEALIVPGAIRSLADRPVHHPLAVYHHGNLLKDPHHPYQGTYAGDEDTCRKPAYHNGTAWTWVFPSFCEAWATVYGESSKITARSWLGSYARLLQKGCIGQVPEILDGDFPHRQRGCDAQAWGASEALRVWKLLTSDFF